MDFKPPLKSPILGHCNMRQFKQDISTKSVYDNILKFWNSQTSCQGNVPDKSDYFPASNIFPGPHLIKKVGSCHDSCLFLSFKWKHNLFAHIVFKTTRKMWQLMMEILNQPLLSPPLLKRPAPTIRTGNLGNKDKDNSTKWPFTVKLKQGTTFDGISRYQWGCRNKKKPCGWPEIKDNQVNKQFFDLKLEIRSKWEIVWYRKVVIIWNGRVLLHWLRYTGDFS